MHSPAPPCQTGPDSASPALSAGQVPEERHEQKKNKSCRNTNKKREGGGGWGEGNMDASRDT